MKAISYTGAYPGNVYITEREFMTQSLTGRLFNFMQSVINETVNSWEYTKYTTNETLTMAYIRLHSLHCARVIMSARFLVTFPLHVAGH